MTRIDQFESVFKAALRTSFEPRQVEVGRVLVISDLEPKDASLLEDRMRAFLASFTADAEWAGAATNRGRTVGELLEVVEEEQPDLICTYRSLYTEGWRWPFSLGEHLDVLTQATSTPVLVMPRPDREDFWCRDELGTRRVMAITDHLDGDARLVQWAVGVTAAGGQLTLCHVEDEAVFERYMDAIGKIASIETETARAAIHERLLEDPRHYIATCRQALRSAGVDLQIDDVVTFGHHLEDVRRLTRERQVDLLVLETKDHDQMAMHGLAYPIAIELRDLPLLML